MLAHGLQDVNGLKDAQMRQKLRNLHEIQNTFGNIGLSGIC